MRRHIVSTALLVLLTTALPALASFTGTDVFLPSVGRGPGSGTSQWYTCVWVHNPGSSSANVQFRLLLRNQPNPSAEVFNDTVPAGDTKRYDNAIETMFGEASFGALRVTSSQKVMVNGRIYSQAAGTENRDSAGQLFAGIPASFAIGSGQSTTVLGTYQTSPQADSQFRYNFGFVETIGRTATVMVTALDETGASVGSKSYPLGGFEARQYNITDLLPGVNAQNLRLQVEVTSGLGKVAVFGSGIANHSNDPSTFEMSFRDELLAENASGGITGVTAGSGLTGGGTAGAVTLNVGAGAGITVAADAVGLADGGVTAAKIAPGQVVKSLNGLEDSVTLAAGSNVTITPSGQTLTIAAKAGGSGDITAVTAGNGLDGGGSSGDVSLAVDMPLNLTGSVASPNAVIKGVNTGSGNGLLGSGIATGVLGTAVSGPGVRGESMLGNGVEGKSSSNAAYAGYFANDGSGGKGVYARAANDSKPDLELGASSASTTVGIIASDKTQKYSSLRLESNHSIRLIVDDDNNTTGEVFMVSTGYGSDLIYIDQNGHVQIMGNMLIPGNATVVGTLSKGGGSFRIDHPLDPENKLLYHSFVESPDMLNVYNGNIVLDERGEASVVLPDWFEALNRDFRYQLTCIGGFAPVFIAEEIAGNRFKIGGGRAGLKVSWMVTGIRQDAFANANRIPVEEDKPVADRGRYLHPGAFGKPAELSVHSLAPEPDTEVTASSEPAH